MFEVRAYNGSDYEGVSKLYRKGELYGGQFDKDRDSPERLKAQADGFANAILVAVENFEVVGTVSLIDDGRVAWLFRFAVAQIPTERDVAHALYVAACQVLRARGHDQVLVYMPSDDPHLASRYEELGLTGAATTRAFGVKLATEVSVLDAARRLASATGRTTLC